MTKQFFLSVIFMMACIGNSKAQVEKNSELYKNILSKDSLLFNIGFNTCNISQFEYLLTEDFEFHHDKSGIANKQKFLNDLRNGLCKSPATYQARRELVKESTEIYPLYNNKILYGAIQKGNHRFYESILGKAEIYVGSAKFTSVWLLEGGDWKLSRSLSYDHQDNDAANYQSAIFDNDTKIEEWLKEINVPTLGLGIIEGGKLQQVKVFGKLQNEATAPYNTVFNVASLTKPVTAMVALKLVSLGKWNLDEPLYKYWTDPDVAKDKNHKLLTTRHILSHQSGFLNWRDEKLRFEFTPGTHYQYSGEGFEYLRKALENKFRKSLNELATELIFVPLNMTDTNYFWDKKIDSTRFSAGYDKIGKPYKTFKNTTANGADDLLTTVEDYGNFLVSVLNGGGLSDNVFKDMIAHQVKIKEDKYFGLGFEIYDFGNGAYALSHGGADKGCQTLVFLLPKSKKGIIIFTNVDDGYKVYEQLLRHYLGELGQRIIDIETK